MIEQFVDPILRLTHKPWKNCSIFTQQKNCIKKVKHQKLYQQVEDILAEEIASGVFNPGDMLSSERELMERFEVGRPSIREALFSLSRRGLIDIGSGRRPRVAKPSFDAVLHELDILARQSLRQKENIFHLMELRRILECALVRKLAIEATEAQIAEIKTKLDQNEASLGDCHAAWKTDADFHRTITKVSGNPLLPMIIDALVTWLIDNRRVTLTTQGSEQRAFKCHQTVYQAIAARQPDAAEQAMAQHLVGV